MIFSGLINLAKIIEKKALDELYDPKVIQEELGKLQLRLEMDEITEEEYDVLETELLERLDKSREL